MSRIYIPPAPKMTVREQLSDMGWSIAWHSIEALAGGIGIVAVIGAVLSWGTIARAICGAGCPSPNPTRKQCG